MASISSNVRERFTEGCPQRRSCTTGSILPDVSGFAFHGDHFKFAENV
jgi:hypothetical protein